MRFLSLLCDCNHFLIMILIIFTMFVADMASLNPEKKLKLDVIPSSTLIDSVVQHLLSGDITHKHAEVSVVKDFTNLNGIKNDRPP